MLKTLVEAKHRGLQTGATFKDAIWAEARKVVDGALLDRSAPDIDVNTIASK